MKDVNSEPWMETFEAACNADEGYQESCVCASRNFHSVLRTLTFDKAAGRFALFSLQIWIMALFKIYALTSVRTSQP